MNNFWKFLRKNCVAVILIAIFLVLHLTSRNPNEPVSDEDISKISGCYIYKDQSILIRRDGIYANLSNGNFEYPNLRIRYSKEFVIKSNLDLFINKDGRIEGKELDEDTLWFINGHENNYYLKVEGNGLHAKMKMSKC